MLQMKTISVAVFITATANTLMPKRRQGICCTNAELSTISPRFHHSFEGAFTQEFRVLRDQATRHGNPYAFGLLS